MFLHIACLKVGWPEPLIAVSPHRYAIMCGIMAEYDTIQNKIKNGYVFKVRHVNGELVLTLQILGMVK